MKTRTETEYIQQLISEGEHIQQDFKFAISDARKIARSISAFANTQGGRLLIGVKDNGKIAGVRSEEEIYMIEAAARMYCRPQVELENYIYKVEGKNVLEVRIAENPCKPICALDEQNKAWAYVRIKDENILANPVHLNIWEQNRQKESVVIAYTEREQHLLNILKQHGALTLNQCSRLSQTNRKQTSELLADFIRFGLVEQDFKEHTFYFKLTENE
ncbi:ATP-binding protein [uncultured Phocaeicola sp.]|uniref:AlbA family DNA-binding domain-containing protein n=1 Tax=uncultured Phocaeicola sp. TaxID=990718 RepID=UPI0030C744A6